MSDVETIKVTINGREIETQPNRLLIDVAEENDVFVPRFCYHPGLDPVAACRMCLVQIEGGKRPLEPACSTRVTDGMAVKTDSQVAKDAQEGVLELLLINHPLDCPICDRGGECPLQDQTMKFGPGSSRYQEEKRHFAKPLLISDLVMLDRERCVLCWRCVRFSEEVAGDPFIDLMDRGSMTQVNIADDKPFESHFSGNTIQICPVGALTSTSYRFASRPWDLQASSTTCSFCSVGCPISLEQRSGEVLRAQALPNESVNSFWNCDKGRFGHRYVSHPERLRAPLLLRDHDGSSEFVETQWDAALDEIAHKLNECIDSKGPQFVGFIGGSHSTNEDLYATSRFFHEVVGTPNTDFRTFDAGFAYELLGDSPIGSSATLDDLDRAATILWFGPDPKEELPVLYLRLKRAASKGVELITVHPRKFSLSGMGIDLRYQPGTAADVLGRLAGEPGGVEVDEALIGAARAALDRGPVVVCVGQQFVGQDWNDSLRAVRKVIAGFDAKLLLCVPNSNSQGALDMGVFVESTSSGTEAMLRAASTGRLAFLWISGADLVADFPGAQLVDAALGSDCYIVVSELFPTDTARSADAILPAMSFAEKEGSFTNLERRIQKVNVAVPAPGIARADWNIFQDLARRFGTEFGWSSSADIADEIARQVPTHAGFSWDGLAQGRIPTLLPAKAAPLGGGGARPRKDTASRVPSQAPPAGAWPLSWELRQVDATRRHGWIWPMPERSGESPMRPETQAKSAEAPPSNGLALLLARTLYDGGAMVTRAPELKNVTKGPFVELHPQDARDRQLAEGALVKVTSHLATLEVPLRISEATPVGSAFMPFDHAAVRANVLLDPRSPMTYVEVSG